MNISILFLTIVLAGLISIYILSSHYHVKLSSQITLRKFENISSIILIIISIIGLIILPYIFYEPNIYFTVFGVAKKDVASMIKLILHLIVTIDIVWLSTVLIQNLFFKTHTEKLLPNEYFRLTIKILYKGYTYATKFLLISFIFILGMFIQKEQIPISDFTTASGIILSIYLLYKLYATKILKG